MSDPASSSESPRPLPFDMALEIVVIPVVDVDRAKRFYANLGWRLDADFPAPDGFRVVQFTPPGSGCSVMMGNNITMAAPGTAQGHYLIVRDLEAARAELIRRGVDVSEPFHDSTGIFHRADGSKDVDGLNPERKSYGSFASFNDPDGNGWYLQEITVRLPGR